MCCEVGKGKGLVVIYVTTAALKHETNKEKSAQGNKVFESISVDCKEKMLIS